LYEALYGNHPLPGATSVAMLETGARAAVPPESTRVPASIGRAVMRGLERDRAKRFPTMATLIAELTPPAQRATARFVAMGLAGGVLLGSATAAVMASRNEPRLTVPPESGPEIKVLLDRIHVLEEDRRRLQDALTKRQLELQEVERLKKELDD